MLETVVLSALAAAFGVAVRAFLEKESLKFYLYHCLSIAVAVGIFTFFYYYSIFSLPLTGVKYFGVFFFFSMVGYVLSDLIDTFTFIARRKKRR